MRRKPLPIKLSDIEKAQLAWLAERNGCTMADWIRSCIRSAYQQQTAGEATNDAGPITANGGPHHDER